jgi:hypothetical protein
MKMKDFKTYLFTFLHMLWFTTVVAQEKIKVCQSKWSNMLAKLWLDDRAFTISNSKFPNRSVAPFNLETRYIKQNQAEAKYAYIKH